MLKFILIRHGTSLGNQELRMMGQLDDELATTGIAESQRLAEQLVREGDRPTLVYCSPQRRAVQTAQILLTAFANENLRETIGISKQSTFQRSNAELGIVQSISPIRLCDHLKELSGGIFEGLTWSQAKTQYPDLCLQLEQNLDLIPIPGSELPDAGFHRACQFWEGLFRQFDPESEEFDPDSSSVVWIVSHSGILQHLIAALLRCDRTWGMSIANTARFEFWLDGDRWARDASRNQHNHNTALWQIRRFNDISHLKPTELDQI